MPININLKACVKDVLSKIKCSKLKDLEKTILKF